MQSPLWLLAFYCSAILLASALGGILPLQRGLSHTQLQMYLSFAAGVTLGTALFHMLPEALHLTESVPATTTGLAVGLLALFLVERFFSSHHHEELLHEGHAQLTWSAAVVGMSLHTLANGVALASAVIAEAPETTGRVLGFGVFLAILLHKPADSLTVVTLMLSSGSTRRRAHLVNLLFAAVVPAGAAGFYLARLLLKHDAPGAFTGAVLAFSTGMFLCIALSDLLPELHFHHHDRVKLSIALLVGVGLMYFVSHLEPHDHSSHEDARHGREKPAGHTARWENGPNTPSKRK